MHTAFTPLASAVILHLPFLIPLTTPELLTAAIDLSLLLHFTFADGPLTVAFSFVDLSLYIETFAALSVIEIIPGYT